MFQIITCAKLRRIFINNDMNYDEITVGDCLEQFEYKNETVLLNDGKVAGFVKNEEKNW